MFGQVLFALFEASCCCRASGAGDLRGRLVGRRLIGAESGSAEGQQPTATVKKGDLFLDSNYNNDQNRRRADPKGYASSINAGVLLGLSQEKVGHFGLDFERRIHDHGVEGVGASSLRSLQKSSTGGLDEAKLVIDKEWRILESAGIKLSKLVSGQSRRINGLSHARMSLNSRGRASGDTVKKGGLSVAFPDAYP